MAGTQSRYEWQFKQRLTSGGLNLQTAYLARNTSELGRLLTGTDNEVVNQSGIFRGFVASVVVGTLKVSVGPGLGQLFDATVPEPDSKAKWMELRSAVEVTLAVGDATNPRWDVIEAQPAIVDGPAEVIDFFDPANNTFSPAVVSPQKIATAALQVRTGTPAANPKLLAGVAGWIPIAYQYVEANALALNVSRTLYCRPILRTRELTTPDNITGLLSQYYENKNISGGGWDTIGTTGLNGTLHMTMAGTFPENGQPFLIPGGTPVSISATGNYVGGGLPLASGTLYAYVAPPPYPTGYAVSMAPRELYIVDTTTPNISATIPAGTRGGIVVISSSDPSATNPLGQRGGPHVVHSFTDNFWGSFDMKRSQMLYIGAAYFDLALPGLVQQVVEGAWVSPASKTGILFTADLPIAAPMTVNVWAGFAGLPFNLPNTAQRVSMAVVARLGAEDQLYIELEDNWTGQGSINTSGAPVFTLYNADPVNAATLMAQYEARTDASGNVKINEATAIGVITSAALVVRAYEDRVIASR